MMASRDAMVREHVGGRYGRNAQQPPQDHTIPLMRLSLGVNSGPPKLHWVSPQTTHAWDKEGPPHMTPSTTTPHDVPRAHELSLGAATLASSTRHRFAARREGMDSGELEATGSRREDTKDGETYHEQQNFMQIFLCKILQISTLNGLNPLQLPNRDTPTTYPS